MKEQATAAAGRFKVSGDIEVNRLGFGAMRVTGAVVWGQPTDRAEATRTLRRLPDLGVNFIDTADSYGPGVSEELIREALHPYDGLLIATKGGLERPGPNQWGPNGRPDFLRQCVQGSLRRLGVERIDLWQLHRIDPNVPRAEQFAAIQEMRQAGLIRHVGLSQASIGDRGGRALLPGRHGAEPLQPRRPEQRGRARPLRREGRRLHSLVSARGRRP